MTEFIPYSCQSITDADIDAVTRVLTSEFLTQGPAIPVFENAFAKRHGFSNAVAVSNATAGLHLSLLALNVGPGSLVWTCPNSFVASANAARYCGADVDFVDIDERTRNISLDQLREKLRYGARTGRLPNVLIPIDFAGYASDMKEIRALADQYSFKIVEDASHATGATYLGQPIGTQYAHIAVFSFHAVKIITTAEGGMISTNDDEVAKRLRQLRTHGITRDVEDMSKPPDGPWYYEQTTLGYNYRMTDLHAALGFSQLGRLDQLMERRRMLAKTYHETLGGLPLLLPCKSLDRESSWHLYVVEVDESRTTVSREKVFAHMRQANIGVNVHYIPIHIQPYYRRMGFKSGDFPVSERYYGRALSIPLFPTMSGAQQARVISELTRALNG